MSFLKQLLFSAFLFSVTASVTANEDVEKVETVVVKVQEYPDLQMTELTLENGMRVILKSTDDDSEICMRLSALGGYAALNSEDRASGELAADMVIESGIGNLCADKLSAFLYDHSIDFELRVEAYTRGMEASLPKESLEAFFILVNKTFTAPIFKQEAFTAVIEKKKLELSHRGHECGQDNILSLVCVQEKHVLHPLKIKDLEKANFNKAKQFFLTAFSDPADFVCVIAGDIDIEKTKKLALEYFSTIPTRNLDKNFELPRYHTTPKDLATKTQKLPNSAESLVRLAFPLQIKLDNAKLEQLELACQMIETRLRNIVKSYSVDAKGVDVWYELPLYPSLEHPWLTIQFHVNNKQIGSTSDLVVKELKRAYQRGFSSEEIKLAAQNKQQSLLLWEHDNDYWIVLLSNHYLWGWDPKKITEKFKNPAVIDPKEIHSFIRVALQIES